MNATLNAVLKVIRIQAELVQVTASPSNPTPTESAVTTVQFNCVPPAGPATVMLGGTLQARFTTDPGIKLGQLFELAVAPQTPPGK